MAVRLADETDLAEHRAQAMQNRTVIDVAIGVIMAQSRCSADEAFDVLRRASNNRNVKLHAVAAELVQRIHPALPQTAFVD
jgi:AmiR/NasT family two-component response regulator